MLFGEMQSGTRHNYNQLLPSHYNNAMPCNAMCYLAKCKQHVVDFAHLQLVTGCGGEALYQTPSTSSQVEQEEPNQGWKSCLGCKPDQTKLKKDEEKNQPKK